MALTVQQPPQQNVAPSTQLQVYDADTLARLNAAIGRGMDPSQAKAQALQYQASKGQVGGDTANTYTTGTLKDKLTSLLPAIGGTIGSIGGGIETAGLGGEIVGGAGGAGIGEEIRDAIMGIQPNVKDIGTQAAIGGAGSLIGAGLGAGARALGVNDVIGNLLSKVGIGKVAGEAAGNTVADISAAGSGRPQSQAAIESLINKGDLQGARNLVSGLSEGDTYKQSTNSLLDSLGAPGASQPTGQIVSGTPKGRFNGIAVKAATTLLKPSASLSGDALEAGVSIPQTYLDNQTALGTDVKTMVPKINSLISNQEGRIAQISAENADKKISGDSIVSALEEQKTNLSKTIGNQDKIDSLDNLINEAKTKYANGVSVSDARDTLRSANMNFGKAVVQDTKGAVTASAQKIEANALRTALKQQYPDIADALGKEQSLIMLRNAADSAAGKSIAGNTLPTDLNPLDLPKGISSKVLQNPAVLGKVASFSSGFGVKNAPSLTSSIANRLNLGNVLTQAVGQAGFRGITGSGVGNGTGGQNQNGSLVSSTPPDIGSLLGLAGSGDTSDESNLLASGGSSAQQGPLTSDMLNKLALTDLLTTGGKNIAALTAFKGLTMPNSAKLNTTIQTALVGNQEASSIVDQIEQGYAGIANTGRIGGAISSVEGKLGINNPTSTYESFVQGALPGLVKSLTGLNRINQSELNQIKQLVPSPSDNAQEAATKISYLRSMIASAKQALTSVPGNASGTGSLLNP